MIAEANQDSQDDLAVPKWPKYENPVSQKSEIETELYQIKKTSAHWKKLYDQMLNYWDDRSEQFQSGAAKDACKQILKLGMMR